MDITIQEAARRLGKSEKTLRRWVHDDKIPARMVEGRYVFTESDIEAHRGTQETQVGYDDLIERIEVLEATVARLEASIEQVQVHIWDIVYSPLEQSETRVYPNVQEKQEKPVQVGRHSQATHGGVFGLPDGLKGWRSFAALHGIAPSTVQKAIETGRLTIVSGKWTVGRASVQGALDATGQAKFYELWHNLPKFQTCPNCPHSLDSA